MLSTGVVARGWRMGIAAALAGAVAAGAVAACSYEASFRDCRIACAAASDCPPDLSCGADGLCRAPGAGAGSCIDVLSDAGTVEAGGGGGARCRGSATECETFGASGPCGGQAGCSWSAASCAMTVDCTELFPGDACDGTAGCQTHVVQPYCRPIAGHCQGTTEAACHSHLNCGFSGGCTGAARPCGTFAARAACEAHAGCSWN